MQEQIDTSLATTRCPGYTLPRDRRHPTRQEHGKPITIERLTRRPACRDNPPIHTAMALCHMRRARLRFAGKRGSDTRDQEQAGLRCRRPTRHRDRHARRTRTASGSTPQVHATSGIPSPRNTLCVVESCTRLCRSAIAPITSSIASFVPYTPSPRHTPRLLVHSAVYDNRTGDASILFDSAQQKCSRLSDQSAQHARISQPSETARIQAIV